MNSRKNTGSYYTPSFLADFISKRVLSFFEGKTRISILEPSVGDGAFVNSLSLSKGQLSIKLNALDINGEELRKASGKWDGEKSLFVETDFLEYEHEGKFRVILGNPPYIRKNRLTEKQIEISKEIHKEQELSEKSVKNIWTTFLVKSCSLLSKDGVLAFILPSELLQVKFTEEIRSYLIKEFERIEIFTFNDLMFECKGQDTIVLFAYRKATEKGVFFTNIEKAKELETDSFILRQNKILIDTKVKWTHHFLSSDELMFLWRLKKQLKTVNDYSDSKPGIVTAANNFFILSKETEAKFELSKYTKPIIQKGLFVNGSVIFREKDFNSLESSNLPTKLLRLTDKDVISKPLRKYLDLGEGLEIHERYKCRIRNKWYVIPNVAKKPEAFFFKRSHLYPKFLKNVSKAFVTDSAYKVQMVKGFDLNSLIYSFYNSLTLTFAEIEGRYYGGGVLELTPSEFKKLPIPYLEIDTVQFNDFIKRFEKKSNIEELLSQNDFSILNPILGIDNEAIEKLVAIRKKLSNKRMRT